MRVLGFMSKLRTLWGIGEYVRPWRQWARTGLGRFDCRVIIDSAAEAIEKLLGLPILQDLAPT